MTFYGARIADDVAERINGILSSCDGMLVMGTSLVGNTSYNMIRRHIVGGDIRPLVIVNDAHTRADAWSRVKIDGISDDIVPHVVVK